MTKEELRERIAATAKGKQRMRYEPGLVRGVVEYARPRGAAGESLARVAEELGLKAETLERWCQRRKSEKQVQPVQPTTARPGPDALAFVRLNAVMPPSGAPVEIAFAGGALVKVPVGFDGPTLSRVLSVLKGAA